jgi:hypothetical protein
MRRRLSSRLFLGLAVLSWLFLEKDITRLNGGRGFRSSSVSKATTLHFYGFFNALTCFNLVVSVLICSLYDSSRWLACVHTKEEC